MTNHTKQFSDIVEKEQLQLGITPIEKPRGSLINDTFIRECIDLFKHINELKTLLVKIRPQYLLFEGADGITDDERDEIDTQSRLKLKEYNGRLLHLQAYEDKRVATKQHFRFNNTLSATVAKHRAGILLSLNRSLQSVSELLLDIQQTRLQRTRNVEDDDLKERLSAINIRDTKYELVHEPHTQEFEKELSQLSGEQLQLLESETDEILNSKLQDLAKVEAINKSVLEIAQLESELASHLSIQSENINSLANDFDDTNVDIIDSNKLLKNAKHKSNYAITTVIYTAVILGLILLFYDYIN